MEQMSKQCQAKVGASGVRSPIALKMATASVVGMRPPAGHQALREPGRGPKTQVEGGVLGPGPQVLPRGQLGPVLPHQILAFRSQAKPRDLTRARISCTRPLVDKANH